MIYCDSLADTISAEFQNSLDIEQIRSINNNKKNLYEECKTTIDNLIIFNILLNLFKFKKYGTILTLLKNNEIIIDDINAFYFISKIDIDDVQGRILKYEFEKIIL